jgi:hypothetical protein
LTIDSLLSGPSYYGAGVIGACFGQLNSFKVTSLFNKTDIVDDTIPFLAVPIYDNFFSACCSIDPNACCSITSTPEVNEIYNYVSNYYTPVLNADGSFNSNIGIIPFISFGGSYNGPYLEGTAPAYSNIATPVSARNVCVDYERWYADDKPNPANPYLYNLTRQQVFQKMLDPSTQQYNVVFSAASIILASLSQLKYFRTLLKTEGIQPTCFSGALFDQAFRMVTRRTDGSWDSAQTIAYGQAGNLYGFPVLDTERFTDI